MQSDNPPILPVGTEVSAKFKGAFCEAKIVAIQRQLRIKVQFSNAQDFAYYGEDEIPNEKIELHEQVSIQRTTSRKPSRGHIVHIKDQSRYDVVFNDGDEATLRRTQLVVKSGKHFDNAITLDNTPLTNPESQAKISPLGLRGAAKRGSQKIRNSLKESNLPSSSRSGGRVDETDDADDGDNDDDDDEEDEEEERERPKRRAASVATAAIEDGKHGETQSDDSAADFSANKEKVKDKKRKKRVEKEKAGSYLFDSDQDDEAGTSSARTRLPNGTFAKSVEKKQNTKNWRPKEKEPKKKLKDEKDDRDEQKKRERKIRQKKAAKERRDAFRKLLRKKKVNEEEESPQTSRLRARRKKLSKRVLYRHSPRLRMRLNELKWAKKNNETESKRRKRRKFIYLPDKIHIRNIQLHKKWNSLCKLARMSNKAPFVKQWRRLTNTRIKKLVHTSENLFTEKKRFQVNNWLERFRGRESEIKVAAFLGTRYDTKVLLDKIITNGEKSFDNRYEIPAKSIVSPPLRSYFLKNAWFPCIVYPDIHDEKGRITRIIDPLGRSERGGLLQVYDEFLIPFHWIPHYKQKELKKGLPSKKEQDRFTSLLSRSLAFDLSRNTVSVPMLRSRLGWNTRDLPDLPTLDRTAVLKHSVFGPTDSESEAESEEYKASKKEVAKNAADYDSDAEIRASVDKDTFIARLMQFYDCNQMTVNTTPLIQGFEVDLHYLYCLVKKLGGTKRVWTSNPWEMFCRKLLPEAIDAEEELKTVFKEFLENYMRISQKYGNPQHLGPRTERTLNVPGQYSETRRRKPRPDEPSTSSGYISATPSRRGGRGGGRGRGRKRKPLSPGESERGQYKKGKPESGRSSRTATEERDSSGVSLSRSGLLNSSSEERDDANSSMMSTDGSERRSSIARRQQDRKKSSLTPKDAKKNKKDDQTPVPAKKGRPRKNAIPVTPATRPARKSKTTDIGLWNTYVNANVLSRIRSGQKIAAFFDKRWYPATASEDVDDFTDKIMEVMLTESLSYTQGRKLSEDSISELDDIYQRMISKTHYTGWNNRYDEYVKLPKLMVTIEDQEAARRRFRHLSRGNELRPEVLALVEGLFKERELIETTEKGERTTEEISSKQLLKMATDALQSPPPIITPPRGRRRSPVASDSSDEEEVEEEEEESEADEKEEKIEENEKTAGEEKEDEDEEEDDEDEEEEEEKEKEKEKEQNEKRNEDELQTRTLTPSDPVEHQSESEKDSDSEEEKEEELNRNDELEDTFTVPSPRPLPMLPVPKKPARRSPSAGLEEESDEPEYPPGPSTPELAAMALAAAQLRPPTLQNNQSVPSLGSDSSDSSNLPVLTPQVSSQSIPATSPPSSTLVASVSPMKPFSPPVPIVHSGPLLLEDVKTAMSFSVPCSTVTPSSSNILPDEEKMREADRKRTGVEPLVEPSFKRVRTISSTEETKSPTRTPLPAGIQNQFSSGALTLDIPTPTETSGPIELPVKGRGKKSTPVFQKPSPSAVTSGPLVISPVERQSQKSPLGRPKKVSEGASGSSTSYRTSIDTDEADTDGVVRKSKEQQEKAGSSSGKESQDSRAPSGSTTPMTAEEKDDETDREQFEKQATPRTFAARGGKRRRGARFGGSYSTKIIRSAVKRKEDNSEDKDTDDQIQSSLTLHSGRSDFMAQKNRVARHMEALGTSQNFHEILTDQDEFDVVRGRIDQKDLALALEERTNALKEEFQSMKAEFAQLEKRWRLQNEAQRREAAEQADSGETGSRSPSVGPSSSSAIRN